MSVADRMDSLNMPKPISPGMHAVLDYLTTGFFFGLSIYFWNRNRRAATAALINGSAVLGASLVTDYPGGVYPLISFEMHRRVDLVQMATAASLPAVMGFGGDRDALPFYAQAANEASVVAMTNWDAGTSDAETRLRAA